MSDSYDLGHLYLLMRRVAAASAEYGARGRVSLSLHCEHAELIRVFMEEVKRVREERAERSDFSEFQRRYHAHLGEMGVTQDEVVEIATALRADRPTA